MKDYYAVIISYNPNIIRLKATADKLRKQGFNILVVDNGSDETPDEVLGTDELILLHENKGVAAALNIGMEEAKKRNGKWVLSLDQDTVVSDNLLCEYMRFQTLPNIGALCPYIIRKGEEKAPQNTEIKKIEKCPTAGFFMPIDVWEKAGQYDEWMFIDYVDYDLCMKIRLLGLDIYQINSTYIVQELGKLYINPLFDRIGKVLRIKKIRHFAHVYNHSPFRNYYFVRNSLYYRHKYANYLDINYEKKHLLKWELKKIVLEKKRIQNIKAIIQGVRDYKEKKALMENAD